MLPYTGNFNTAIKAQARDVDVVIAYKSSNSYIFLNKGNIQSLTFNSKADKGLGGVVKKVCDIKAMYNEYTSNIVRGTALNIYYKCGTGMCKKAILYVNSVKVNKDNTLITIEALDLLSYDKNNKHMPIMKNCSLIDYESAIFRALGYDYKIDSGVANPNLSLGYPKSGKVYETLNEIAIANNALIDFDENLVYSLKLPFTLTAKFQIPMSQGYIKPGQSNRLHVKKFVFKSVPDDVLDEDSDIINYEIDEDDEKYGNVIVNLFFPSSGEQKSLGNVEVTIPSAAQNYNIGTVNFGNTMIPTVCSFKGKVDIASYDLSSKGCSFRINNNTPIAQATKAEFFGFDVTESTLENTDSDNDVKQISNMYIQSPTAYDTNIFKNPNCTLKTFGNPLYEIGDTIQIGDKLVLILEENLVFNGGLKCTLKGVVKDA